MAAPCPRTGYPTSSYPSPPNSARISTQPMTALSAKPNHLLADRGRGRLALPRPTAWPTTFPEATGAPIVNLDGVLPAGVPAATAAADARQAP